MVIRLGDERDITKVSRLWLEMTKEKHPDWTPNMGWWRIMAHYGLQSKKYYIVVAEEGGKIVGFTTFIIAPEPSDGKIHGIGQHIYVTPEYRNKSVGYKMNRFNLAFSKKVGVEVWDLFCNHGEENLWKKKGWSESQTQLRKEV